MDNNTFRPDFDAPQYNAIVGLWGGSDDYAYVLGFGQAVEVLLSSAIEEAYTDQFTGQLLAVYIDALIHPICFCARHFVELYLKRQIRIVSSLKSGQSVEPDTIHDLQTLWKELESHLAKDKRLKSMGERLRPYVEDIAAVDVTGETFRYRTDKQGEIHLRERGHINIAVFGTRFKEMMAITEEFELLTQLLVAEYEQQTTTDRLSRAQIEAIARRLPPHATWTQEILAPIKQQLMVELDVSSNAIGRAMALIKSHREFSALIGQELKLDGLSPEVFARLEAIENGDALETTVSDEEWHRLDAILEVGRPYHYSEQYDEFVTSNLSSERKAYPARRHILRGILSPNRRFSMGLRKLGQSTLLEAFSAQFPDIPEIKRINPDEFRDTLRRQLDRMKNSASGAKQQSSDQ